MFMNMRIIFSAILLVGSYAYAVSAAGHASHPTQRGDANTVGEPAPAAQATQVIHVTASDDMRFKFSKPLTLSSGDVIRFVVQNTGKVPHEFSIGDEKEQKAHQIMMRKMPDMVHNDANTVTIQPGETKEITWEFKGDKEVVFACNIPGHYEAGMYKKASIRN